jgi:hypothetical protein
MLAVSHLRSIMVRQSRPINPIIKVHYLTFFTEFRLCFRFDFSYWVMGIEYIDWRFN